MQATLLSLLLLLGLAPSAIAQSLFTVDLLTGDFHSIDCRTGEYSHVGSTGSFLVTWNGMAKDSSGNIFVVGLPANQLTHSDLYLVNPSLGSASLISSINLVGINAIAFGPGDVLYAAADLNYPNSPGSYSLFSIDVNTGNSTLIGAMGLEIAIAMDCSALDMFVWDGFQGLHSLDLNTGLATDINPGFLGNNSLSTALSFSDEGILYALDYALWVMEPTTGVGNFVDFSYPGIVGGMEFIPGPSEPFVLWQTEQVGIPTSLKLRGATPGGQVAILAADDTQGSFLIPPRFQCAGTLIDMNSATTRLVSIVTANAQGEINLGPLVLPMRARGHLRLQAVDLQTCITSNRIETVF